MHTMFCGDYACVHYFLGRLRMCALLLCSMTYYDITMGNIITRNAHCLITIDNDVARDIHCGDITMSNGVAMCTYHGITMLNEPVLLCIAMPNYDIAVLPENSLKLYT